MRGKLALGIRTAFSRTSNAAASKLTRFGASSAPSRRTRTLQRRSPAKLATFGFGLRPMPKPSLFHRYVGSRGSDAAMVLMDDLARRLANRVQLTTDGHKAYLEAVEGAFGGDIDYGMLVKLYGESVESEKRYSPAECIGCRKTRIEGDPDPAHIS